MKTLVISLQFFSLIVWAQTQVPTYTDHFSCFSTDPHTPGNEVEWSGLAGFLVGPGPRDRFKSPREKILRPFSSDGCTMSMDGFPGQPSDRRWLDCCVSHDHRYWRGGTETEKDSADQFLEKCIAGKGHPEVGKIYRAFVKRFGGPRSSQTFRWGYGWNYKRSFKALSVEEEKQVLGLDLPQTAFQLVRVCDTYDLSLRGFSKDEIAIYAFLNSKLREDDQVEWAQKKYFNSTRREYSVKLAKCKAPVKLVFEKNNQVPWLQTECGNFDSMSRDSDSRD